jgi:hypothetical protein
MFTMCQPVTMCAHYRLDAVIICSPTSAHEEQIKSALAAGMNAQFGDAYVRVLGRLCVRACACVLERMRVCVCVCVCVCVQVRA